MKLYRNVFFGAGCALLCIALILAFYAPAPWKLWGAYGVLVFISSQVVLRAIQTVTSKSCLECLPYIVATFLAIVPVMLFAPDQYSHIALIVWLALLGVAMFYWAVAGIFHEAQRIGRKLGALREEQASTTS